MRLRDRAAPGARAGRAGRRAGAPRSRSAAAVTSAPSTNARLRPCAVTSRRTISSRAVARRRRSPGRSRMSSPVRTRSAEARPPSSRPTASTRIDLPAPVSPVRTFRPGVELDLDRFDDGQVADAEESEHARPHEDGLEKPELPWYHTFDSHFRCVLRSGQLRCPSGATCHERGGSFAHAWTPGPCAAGAGRGRHRRPGSGGNLLSAGRSGPARSPSSSC